MANKGKTRILEAMNEHDALRQFLESHHLRLNKDLGQHFLVDQTVLDAIIDAAKITADDHIVEIGPGIGVLTKELVDRAKEVTAIELDARMIPLLGLWVSLHRDPEKTGKLTIINKNALHVDFPKEPYKIVANIPYHITSPLLRHAFLESETYPQSMTLLIQREVAEKICDPQDAGILTILVGLFGAPRLVTFVPPKAFLPPPKVDSAVLHIDCFEKPLADPKTIEKIFRLTKIGFGQKRKMLRNTIGSLEGGMELLAKNGIDPIRRPQTLSVEEWIALARHSDESDVARSTQA